MPKTERLIASVFSKRFLLELNDQQKRALLDYIGYDYYTNEKQLRDQLCGAEKDEIEEEIVLYKKASQFLTNVQYLLSCYSDGVENLDRAPTDTATKDHFKKLHNNAEALYGQLIRLNSHYRAELRNIGYDTPDFIERLSEFIKASDRIARKPQAKDGRGSKKEIARQAIINGLAENFDRFCAEGFTEQSKIEFIKCALGFGHIPSPKRIKHLLYRDGDKRIVFKQVQ